MFRNLYYLWHIESKLYELNTVRKRSLQEAPLKIKFFTEIEHYSIKSTYTIEKRLSEEKYSQFAKTCAHANFRFLYALYSRSCVYRVSTYIYSVFTFIALQCIVDGSDLRLCRFSITRRARPARRRDRYRGAISRPFRSAASIAWLSKLGRVEKRVNNLSTATTVVDRRCRYSAIEKLTQNTVDCVKSTAD